MTPRENGFILLSSHLGYQDRPVLTSNMMKHVQEKVTRSRRENADRPMCTEDLLKMGLGEELAQRVIRLMQDRAMLNWYMEAAARAGCVALTPVSTGYPQLLWQRLKYSGPCCLWAKGNLDLLSRPAVAVVGSRDPKPAAVDFAVRAGQEIARQGYVIVSGNARGVDQLAQNACLEAGGSVISVVADTLYDKQPHDRLLFLSENDFDLDFSAGRALSRNHVIHAMGVLTLVSQCGAGRGGTWSGSYANLQNKWSPLACLDDGMQGTEMLRQLGAKLVTAQQLGDLRALVN